MPRRPNKFYVVTRGRKPGIYDSWIEANSYTTGVTGAVHQSFESYEAALAIWEKAQAKGWVERCGDFPQPASRAASRRPLGPSSSLSSVDISPSSSAASKTKVWYVITRGRETGVFDTWIETRQYVDGIPDAVYQSFDDEQKAKRVYADAWDRGDIEEVAKHPTSLRKSALSTPPLTPVKNEAQDLTLDGDQFSGDFGKLGLSLTAASSPSTYRTASSPALVNDNPKHTYSPPKRLAQHISLPTRLPSDKVTPIARASSERPVGARDQDDEWTNLREHIKQLSIPEKPAQRNKGRIAVGDPPYLQGYPTSPCKQLIPRGILLSPLTDSGITLRNVDNARSSSHSRSNSISSRMTTPQTVTALQSPLAQSISALSTPRTRPKESARAKPPNPSETRNGTSTYLGDYSTSPNRERTSESMSLSKMGLSPPLVPHSICEVDTDPRSPASKRTPLPFPMNSISFGRPSPAYSMSTLVAL